MFRKLIGKGVIASALILGIAALGFSVLDFLILSAASGLAGPNGPLGDMFHSVLLELDPDDDELILSSIFVSLPAALVMALWIWRDRFGLPRAAAEIAPSGMAALGGQVAPPAATPNRRPPQGACPETTARVLPAIKPRVMDAGR